MKIGNSQNWPIWGGGAMESRMCHKKYMGYDYEWLDISQKCFLWHIRRPNLVFWDMLSYPKKLHSWRQMCHKKIFWIWRHIHKCLSYDTNGVKIWMPIHIQFKDMNRHSYLINYSWRLMYHKREKLDMRTHTYPNQGYVLPFISENLFHDA